MESDIILVHTHFHKRRTGVTRSIENVIPYLKSFAPTYLYGYGVEGEKVTTKQLKKIIFSDKNVVVHCHRNNEIMKMLLYRLLGAKFKLVSTRHAESAPSGLTRFLLKKSDAVVTLTKSMYCGLGIESFKVPHGVNTDIFCPKEDSVLNDVRQENIIICAGRVRKAKGQVILLEGSVEILKKYPDWALVIVGKVDKPQFLESLQELVKTHGVGGQVYFVDETPDIIKYYQASKVAIVPFFTEGFSLVCAEAMSCENTVIATKNVGVHSELISDKKSGYLFKAGDSRELQSILENVVNGSLPSLGKEAREEIEEHWSAKKEAEGLYNVYLKTLG